jgi:hypothetical protein
MSKIIKIFRNDKKHGESMKKLIIAVVLGCLGLGCLYANHFIPAWWGQNPYLAMNIYVYSADVLGQDLTTGDEIGIFDGTTLVGAAQLTSLINNYPAHNVPVIVSMTGGGVPGSAAPGHFVTFKVWKASSSTEYTYPEMSVQFAPPYVTTFSQLGTSFITRLSYSTPTGMNSQTLTPPPGPSGGYVNDISFPGTGFLLNQIYILPDGGGEMTAYSFNTPTLDWIFSGTPPLYNTGYGWFIDPQSISYFAADTFPIVISFNLTGLARLGNPSAVMLYRRDIHGTGPFTEVTAVYNEGTGYLTANVTALGEFILGSNDASNAHGNLEGHVYVYGGFEPIAGAEVTIGTRSVQTNSSGYYVFLNHATGSFTVSFNADGYETDTQEVTIEAGTTLTCDAFLHPLSQPPGIPQNVIINRMAEGLNLSWSASVNAVSYHVYGSSLPEGTYQLLTDTELLSAVLTDSFLLAQGLTPEKSFFYITADSE